MEAAPWAAEDQGNANRSTCPWPIALTMSAPFYTNNKERPMLMASVTLILTRTPLHEFVYTSRGNVDADNMADEERARFYRSRTQPLDRPPNVIHYSGRWGSLLLLRGPRVYGVVSIADNSPAPATVGGQNVTLADQNLQLTTDGAAIGHSKEYTSMERYRTDYGDLRGRWVMLHPRPNAYDLTYEPHNPVVQTLRTGHSGNCIRVGGGDPGPEQGILIHESPNVTWLKGCISPRPKDDKREFENADGNPSFRAQDEIMRELNTYGAGRGSLYVLV